MNHVLVFAGGVGARMKSADIPKQFIEVDGKPIIIRTLENFCQHPFIEDIVISCLENKIEYLWDLCKKYEITKIKDIVKGGDSGHASIHNGLIRINEFANKEDIVLICDGVRPLISGDLISHCIEIAKEHGTAVPVTPSVDSVLESVDGKTCCKNLPRGYMYITQAPQGYTMEKIMWAHAEAERRKIMSPTSSSELLIELGEAVQIFIGERENIKVTTPEDLRYLRSRYYYKHFINFAAEELQYDT